MERIREPSRRSLAAWDECVSLHEGSGLQSPAQQHERAPSETDERLTRITHASGLSMPRGASFCLTRDASPDRP